MKLTPKRIGGHLYAYRGFHTRKSEATKTAARIRKNGGHARIFKDKLALGTTVYRVFASLH